MYSSGEGGCALARSRSAPRPSRAAAPPRRGPSEELHEVEEELGYGKACVAATEPHFRTAGAPPHHDRCSAPVSRLRDEEAGVRQSQASSSLQNGKAFQVASQAFTLTFLAEWGDRSQVLRPQRRRPACPLSPSACSADCHHRARCSEGPGGRCDRAFLPNTPSLVATHPLARSAPALPSMSAVVVGGCLGHSICTTIAVVGGRLLATRISEKHVALMGTGAASAPTALCQAASRSPQAGCCLSSSACTPSCSTCS